MGGMTTYTPGQTAEKTGFSLDTLRYYERIGLLDDGGGIRDVAGTGHPLTAIGRGLAA